jgi:hypothetical protein
MARDDVFLVRHKDIPSIGEGQADRAIINRMGAQVVVDFYTQLLLSGYCFHIQTGTEDAPITTNGPLDDTKPVIVADCTSGAIIPLLFEVNTVAHSTSTLIAAMLEADMDKARYSSGGTVYVPEQMNKAATSAAAASGTFYTIEGSDIVAAAKTAVPASVELGRKQYSEDVIADPAGAMGSWIAEVFSCKSRTPVVLTNPGSLCGHFGSATADITGHAALQFAQFPASLAY